jgi:flagellar biosynthesis/type III secretory pathway protein FliH
MSEILPGASLTLAPVPWRTVNRALLAKDAAETAGRELEQRIEQARREGEQEGLRLGRDEVQRLLPSTLENIAASLAELEKISQRLREQTCQDLVRLAITVAARVTHREAVVNPNAMAGLAKTACPSCSREKSAVCECIPRSNPASRKLWKRAEPRPTWCS